MGMKITTSKETDEQKALKVIEALHMCYENGHKTQKNAEDILDNIYRISHGVGKHHSCYETHESWRKEIDKLYKEFKEIGFI